MPPHGWLPILKWEQPRQPRPALSVHRRYRAAQCGDPEEALLQQPLVGRVGEGAVEANPDGQRDEGGQAARQGVDLGLAAGVSGDGSCNNNNDCNEHKLLLLSVGQMLVNQ